MKSLDISKLTAKRTTTISSKEALKDIISINWLIDENTHVYCTDCVYGEELFECFTLDNINKKIPSFCNECYPYDPEDSRPFRERPCYRPE